MTSYDYNAPLSEDGRHNVGNDGDYTGTRSDKFAAVRQHVLDFYNLTDGVDVPQEKPPLPVQAYDPVVLRPF